MARQKTSHAQLIIAAAVIAALVLGFLWLRRHQNEPEAEVPATQKPGVEASNAIAVGADALNPANLGAAADISAHGFGNAIATSSKLEQNAH